MCIDVSTKVICLCLIKYSCLFVPGKPHFVRGILFSSLTVQTDPMEGGDVGLNQRRISESYSRDFIN